MQIIREEMPRCTCRNLLRTETERAEGRCIECGMQTALNEARVNEIAHSAKVIDQAIDLTAAPVKRQAAETTVSAK